MNSRTWLTWLTGRWPTALALAATGLTFGGAGSAEGVAGLAQALPLLPLLYLVMAKLRRRAATWPGVGIGLAVVVGLRMLDVVQPATVLTAIALVVLVWAGVDGQLRRDGTFRVQALGMLLFGGLALAGLAVDPELARYLVAAGWFFHGVWDFVHLKLDKVVARSFAEWCGVVDIMIAAQLVLML
ncbi:hypothetical protein [Nonomuraea sp. SBT364]|uniref:hypothetical protein n=1 Tax=Nonomuraea sp. SBT364 TaxID=1580530 RepID=UPI00066D6A19|nr:hypothetical protein [Nonomuraea sp. SBT364]